ncbi:exopolyphosphatase [Shewanella gelidii]|uniref:Exopolyphosphatase n=1 Tax=Shewanella gelidii TaxID=1642821 RepID=A0A917JPP6_9GAMM|nr:exopolyphosphatase [Shewanella gelidii]MCL1099487.1 exopolyphosphatase [Shewanella gelidii]GGI77319.1 exopolyphosphatase [Shewanella gelidii]
MANPLEVANGRLLVAIDLGSNSFHLGIAREVNGNIQPMYKVKQRVQLAENQDEQGNLCTKAIDRGIECLKQYSQRLSEMRFDDIRIVATFALRQAPNRKLFIKQARAVLDYPIEIISGKEEARLIYAGVSQSRQITLPSLVIDIGGGSTELIVGQGHKPFAMESLSMGCVSYQSRYFPDGSITSKRMKKAVLAAEQQLEVLQKRYLSLDFKGALGCSGTVKAITSLIHQGDLTQSITLDQLNQFADVLIDHQHVDALPYEDLAALRRKVLPSGLAILIACFKQLEIKSMSFCDSALREGVLNEMADKERHHDIQLHSINHLQISYQLDQLHSEHIRASAGYLYHCFEAKHPEHKSWLSYAAAIHEIGLQINYRSIHKHGEYILSNINLAGFNLEEQQFLAFLVRWHRKKLYDCEVPLVQFIEEQQIWPLLICLRLSVLLHLGRRHHIALPQLKQKNNSIQLIFDDAQLDDELLIADLEEEQLQLKQIGWHLTW